MNMEEFITDVLHDRKESFGYGTCSNYLACSIESSCGLQNTGFGDEVVLQKSSWPQALEYRVLVMESFSREVVGFRISGKIRGGEHFKKIFRLVTTVKIAP